MLEPDRFQTNVERWSLFCPVEAAALSTVDDHSVEIVEGIMQVHEENGDLFFCESPKDPQEEASRAIHLTGLTDVNVVYVYGVGSGFMYDELKSWLRESSLRQLIFLEADLRVVKKLFQTERGTSILHDSQTWLYYLDAENKVLDKTTSFFALQPWRFITLQRYLDKDPIFLQKTRSKLDFLASLKHTYLFEYMQFGWGYFQNFFRNIFQLPRAGLSSGLYGRFSNIPAIICGAGPSLDKNLHLLQGLKDRALIFAGGTAMNAVNASGCVPHFGVGIDPNPDQFTRLITNIAFETPYFYRNRLQNSSLSLIHGDHLYVPGSGGYGITKWLEEKLGIAAKDIPEGCNVINFSLAIAAEMGCNPIIFVGVDLAYSDEKSYASGILNHPLHTRRQHFKTKNSQEELIVKPDIYGKGVYSLWKWVMESCWLTTFSAHHPRIKMINATEGGLGFANIPNMTLQEAIDKYLGEKYDLAGFVHAETQRSGMPPDVTEKKIESLMDQLLQSLNQCFSLCLDISKDAQNGSDDQWQEGEDAKNFLSAKGKEQLLSLEAETAYVNLLKTFDDAFLKYKEGSFARLEIDKEILGAKDVRNHKRRIFAERYQFLANTASSNIKHLKDAVEESYVRTAMVDALGGSAQHVEAPAFDENNFAKVEKTAQKQIKNRENGTLQAEYYTIEGVLHGPFTCFDEAGRVTGRSQFSHGLRSGPAVYYYPSGRIASIQFFEKDLQDGKQMYYYSNGALRAQIEYSQGRLHGCVKLYSTIGRLCRELFFAHGKREGIERVWNHEGLLVIEAGFKEDLPYEKARRWYDNGNQALEMLYDKDGNLTSVRKWDPQGIILPQEENCEDDYFDKVTKQTGVLTNALDDVVKQLLNVVPLVTGAMSKNGAQEESLLAQKDLATIKEEMKKLREINQQLMIEAGLDPAAHKEPLWKTPSNRRELELQIEEKTKAMTQELSLIQISLAKALRNIASQSQSE